MKKIKTSFKKVLKFAKEIKISDFFKDFFILSMIFSGVILGGLFFYYIKSKFDYSGISGASLSEIEYEYAYPFTENGFYKSSEFVLFFSLINILIAKLVYTYDILASYILAASVPILNIIYFASTVLLFSFS